MLAIKPLPEVVFLEALLRTAEKIRAFHRFYLPYFHLLTQKYLNSECSMAEARVLYQLYTCQNACAVDIVSQLNIDKSYLSRTLKRFEQTGIVEKRSSPEDARRAVLTLTNAGKALTERLIRESNRQVALALAGLTEDRQAQLTWHMEQIMTILKEDRNGPDQI